VASLPALFAFPVHPDKRVPVGVFDTDLATEKPLFKSIASEHIAKAVCEFATHNVVVDECADDPSLLRVYVKFAFAFTEVKLPFTFVGVAVAIEHTAFVTMAEIFQDQAFVYITVWVPDFAVGKEAGVKVPVFERPEVKSLRRVIIVEAFTVWEVI
jgi:hypothetical protein